ncbi:DUF4249 family protein [Niabella aurantiaca]|uniref:DUF4249 family protein n=1 Tax=Niabella aurantiaca TaxID=379900 RepID=UPI0003795ABF|nr:DUF4249 family protein [Niabella aurantiaca]
MKIFKIYLIIQLSICLVSCTEKVIEPDLKTVMPRLAVDASIDWVKNTSGNEQKIKLTTTTGYYSNEFPTVSGANIVIANSTNTIFHFIENPGTGEYICSDFQPVIGETYTLTVSLNGESYIATETLMSVPDIENNIEQNNKGGMGGDEVEITYYYHDNATLQNNYLYSVRNPRVAFPEYEAENDENTQGNLVPVYYSNKDLKAGDLVNIKIYGISKRYYEYFRKLLAASGADTGPFPTTPGSVRGNILNQTNSANFAYGYFRLSEVDVKDYTIQ